MKISVLGAGAIGSLVAGYLYNKGQEAALIGRPEAVDAIREKGLQISGVRGDFNIKLDASSRLSAPVDLLILAVKTQDIEEALKDNLKFLNKAAVLNTQNGIQADFIVSKYIAPEKIVSSIVMFGSTYLEPGKVVHNFEGDWIIGRIFDCSLSMLDEIKAVTGKIFPTVITDNIKGMKYLKVFINANNCIPAILGVSMQEALSDISISRLAMGIWQEGLNIVNKSGISLVSLPEFPAERVTKLASMPLDEAAKVYSGFISSLSKEPLYGSILQSIKRGKPSEIDYINGEFVRLAKTNNTAAALNEKLIEMVHTVEKTGRFFSKEELLQETKGLI
jgi:2-dehydropantoate 2-reductase